MTPWHLSKFDPRVKPDAGMFQYDPGHPLAPKLGGWLFTERAGAVFMDLNNRFPGARIGTGGWQARAGDFGLGLNGSNAYGNVPGIVSVMPGRTKFTYFAKVFRVASTDLTMGCTTTNGNRTEFEWASDNNIYCVVETSVSFPFASCPETGVATVAMAYDGSLTSTARTALYVNAKRKTLTAGGGDPASAVSAFTGNFNLGYEQTGGAFGQGAFFCAYVFDRTLSGAEIAWLHAEPYAMLRPYQARVYSVPTANVFRRALSSRLGSRTAA
jgi:hypothetical protein